MDDYTKSLSLNSGNKRMPSETAFIKNSSCAQYSFENAGN